MKKFYMGKDWRAENKRRWAERRAAAGGGAGIGHRVSGVTETQNPNPETRPPDYRARQRMAAMEMLMATNEEIQVWYAICKTNKCGHFRGHAGEMGHCLLHQCQSTDIRDLRRGHCFNGMFKEEDNHNDTKAQIEKEE